MPDRSDRPRTQPLILVSVGNSRTRYALATAAGAGAAQERELQPAQVAENADPAAHGAIVERLTADAEDADVLVASVNDRAADAAVARLVERLGAITSGRIRRFGRDITVPIPHTLPSPITVGHDRLLCALGAFARSEQACVVVDAGTAITVDFVDGHGVFHGGAIAPGLKMMLRSLHDGTAALPLVELPPVVRPDDAPATDDRAVPFGKTTQEAIRAGVVAAARGLVHTLVDSYAEFYRAYPRVIATGGDAPRLFDNDPIVERVEPDLILIGMLSAWELSEEE
jgi:type III pantothenate kinase